MRAAGSTLACVLAFVMLLGVASGSVDGESAADPSGCDALAARLQAAEVLSRGRETLAHRMRLDGDPNWRAALRESRLMTAHRDSMAADLSTRCATR